ncbi:MAG: hypothetical protein KGI80_04250 [Verrucomicrobiota bacterium]|nr:hypothetical protein [Verrucomicrobiota bacterium]
MISRLLDCFYPSLNLGDETCLKKVTFDETVRVVLIPTKEEYKTQGVAKDIWMQESDYTFSNRISSCFLQYVKNSNIDLFSLNGNDIKRMKNTIAPFIVKILQDEDERAVTFKSVRNQTDDPLEA